MKHIDSYPLLSLLMENEIISYSTFIIICPSYFDTSFPFPFHPRSLLKQLLYIQCAGMSGPFLVEKLSSQVLKLGRDVAVP